MLYDNSNRLITCDLGDKGEVFSKRLHMSTKHEKLQTRRELVKFTLATLIILYQPRVALLSLSKENGSPSAKGMLLFMVLQDEISEKSSTILRNDM